MASRAGPDVCEVSKATTRLAASAESTANTATSFALAAVTTRSSHLFPSCPFRRRRPHRARHHDICLTILDLLSNANLLARKLTETLLLLRLLQTSAVSANACADGSQQPV